MPELDLIDVIASLCLVGGVYFIGMAIGRCASRRYDAQLRKEIQEDAESARSYRGADGHE